MRICFIPRRMPNSVVPLWSIIVLYLICLDAGIVSDQRVKIGVLHSGSRSQEAIKHVVELAIDTVHLNDLLPPNVTLQVIYNVTGQRISAFENLQCVCYLIEQGVSVVIGPGVSTAVKATQYVCEGMHVPQISPSAADPELFMDLNDYRYLFKMNFPFHIQSRVIADIIRHFGWQRMAMIVQYSDEGRHGYAELHKLATDSGWTISAVEFIYPVSNSSTINTKQQLINIKNKGVRVVILACDVDYAQVILEQAFAVDMVRAGWMWLLTDSDTSINDLFDTCTDPPLYLRGIIAIRTAYGRGDLYANYSRQLQGSAAAARKLDAVLMRTYDATLMALYGLADYFSAGHVISDGAPRRTHVCSTPVNSPRADGQLLREYILNSSGPGAMRYLNFTRLRNPPTYEYEVVNLRENGWMKVGDWSDTRTVPLRVTDTVKFNGDTSSIPSDTASELTNLTLEVVTILEAPFAMMRTEGELKFRPDQLYKGYCVELLNLLQRALGFRYNIHVVYDGNYGSRKPNTNQWNGIVGEIIRGDADMAIAPLTITFEREQYVDFTKPFFDLGLAVLTAKEAQRSKFLAFLEPFHWNLWICVIFSFFICGTAVTLCSYVSPFGYYGRYVQRLDLENEIDKEKGRILNLLDNLWYTYASWQQQGPEVTSRCLSGRIIHGIWWFFITLITATYTANLTAFLTVDLAEPGISSIQDLAYQTEVSYGTVSHSAPSDFFTHQNKDPYRRMYEYMSAENTWLPNATTGINRVQASYALPRGSDGRFAFIFDSTTLEYAAANKPCNTRVVGKIFNRFGYGLAFRKNSPFKDMFSLEILKLRQNGELGTLRSKWFAGTCDVTSAGSSAIATRQVSLASMAGVFVFLALGIVIGLAIILCEICAAAHRDTKGTQGRTWSQALGYRFSSIRKYISKHLCHTLSEPDTQNDFQRNTIRPSNGAWHTAPPSSGHITQQNINQTIIESTNL